MEKQLTSIEFTAALLALLSATEEKRFVREQMKQMASGLMRSLTIESQALLAKVPRQQEPSIDFVRDALRTILNRD